MNKASNNYIPVESLMKESEQPAVNGRKIFVETYGCQMNSADSEIVNGIMGKFGYSISPSVEGSNVVLLNTCSIREHAESKIFQRLSELRGYKKSNPGLIVGVIGCMAERMRREMLERSRIVDLIIGPDEYRKLPYLIENVLDTGETGIAVKLSRVETYDDIKPLRKHGICAWLSVMRGCDKFCSFCVVPFTRGRERSRSLEGVVAEVTELWDEGFREVTLLGQNVNSYRSGKNDFSDLLSACASAVPEMRIRFTTSHPQDISLKLIETIASHDNLCKYIHLPLQSGSDRILGLMKRNYSVNHYLEIIDNIRKLIPNISLSTDIIAGFPTETVGDHKMTLDVMDRIKYDGAYMFKYSARARTKAFEMGDDVDDETKTRRLMEIIEMQRRISYGKNREMEGKVFEILIESASKKSRDMLVGRTDCNRSVIIPRRGEKIGSKVSVKIKNANSATLFGDVVRN